MQAIVCTQYGTPDVLQLQEVPVPLPGEREVRIRVAAATVGPSDCAFRKGDPFIIKLIYGLKKPKYPIMGTELAGVVDAVGSKVTTFKAGDRVLAISPNTFGAYAQYVCLPEDGPMIHQSPAMAHEDAAAICDGPPTALTFLRDKARLQHGQRILIIGASGAVGSYAVQLAKHYGADVAGVCSGVNVEWVKELGASRVFDYTREDFVQSGAMYDVIFDAVGKSSFGRCRRLLAPGGMYLTTVPSAAIMLQMLWTSLAKGKKAVFATAGLMQSKANLHELLRLHDAGALKPAIDRRYPLAAAADAHRYVDTGRKKGNVLLVIDEP